MLSILLLPSLIPVADNDSLMEEIELVFADDGSFTTRYWSCDDVDPLDDDTSISLTEFEPKSKNAKVRVNINESAVKPEPELKNTVGCNLNPSDGPGKPNSIIMKTVKTKWALNHLQQPICVQLTKTVKTLKAQS
ncbi:hypothetical protein Tco_0538709 [Tanacetum coccineum]